MVLVYVLHSMLTLHAVYIVRVCIVHGSWSCVDTVLCCSSVQCTLYIVYSKAVLAVYRCV